MARLRNRQVTVRLTQAELDVVETARQALHSRGALRHLPSWADTLSILAAALCQLASQGYTERAARCRAALSAWEQEHGPRQLQRVLGSWLAPPE